MRFSGHETFIVRNFWPKKGYDFIKSGGNFNDENAVVELGVGKNMVSSINFWMKALGLFDEKEGELTTIANVLFGENGYDPYLEDIGSIWLLHYLLVKTNYASIYNLVFNDFRKERVIFTKKQLISFIRRKFQEKQLSSYNQNTVEKDISVFLRLYGKVEYTDIKKDFEDEFSSLMLELELISRSVEEEIKEGKNKKERNEWFYLNGESRSNLPFRIVLFAILDTFENEHNISFKRLELEHNSPSLVFLLNKEGLYRRIKEMEEHYGGLVLSETAGNVVLVLPDYMNKWDVLRHYYELNAE